MKIILIGNYKLDKQESMQRFALMLEEGFNNKGIPTELWMPIVFFGTKFKVTNAGIGKWFGYIDKYLLFPVILKLRISRKKYQNTKVVFHICDHSNAPYLRYLPKERTGITCHDVLAIRGALGFTDAYAPASRMGIVLQKWILKNLSKAEKLAAVSHFTLNQLEEIHLNGLKDKQWMVIHNAFNAPFKKMEYVQGMPMLKEIGLNESDAFILHVGSNELRKNRKLLLQMVSHLGNDWSGKICFAGKPLDNELITLSNSIGLTNRVVSVVSPRHEILIALYSRCEAFIFPSFSEGFGWPIIEAQACGAPVIASNLEPMPEVSGKMAIHVNPNEPEKFAKAFLSLKNNAFRDEIIKSGYKNAERFHLTEMIDAYLELYGFSLDN